MNLDEIEGLIRGFRMADGARINFEAGGRWSICDMDSRIWLCARGEGAVEDREVYWNFDRKTHFATIEGALEAWLIQYRINPSIWKE